MIALFLASLFSQTSMPSAPPAPLGPIGSQSLPAAGCAAFLWSTTDRQLVAMATASSATLRVSIDGRTVDLVRSAQQGAVTLGFGATTSYGADGIEARLDMTIVARENLTAGAQVSQASLQVDRPGHDSIIVPVAGLIGCTT